MTTLTANIRQAVRDERYVFGAHADQRLRERRIMGWQVTVGVDGATLVKERPDATPNPTENLINFWPMAR